MERWDLSAPGFVLPTLFTFHPHFNLDLRHVGLLFTHTFHSSPTLCHIAWFACHFSPTTSLSLLKKSLIFSKQVKCLKAHNCLHFFSEKFKRCWPWLSFARSINCWFMTFLLPISYQCHYYFRPSASADYSINSGAQYLAI